MTNKQRIIEFIQRMPDDISVAEAIYKLRFWEQVEIGLRQAGAGELTPHEEVEREFCRPDFDPD